MSMLEVVTELEASDCLARWVDECCAVHCEEGQAIRLAGEAASKAHACGLSVKVIVPNDHARHAILRELDDSFAAADVLSASELVEYILSVAAELEGTTPPTILDSIQRQLLFEDMKVLGGKPRRIEEMMKFLCRGISQFAYEDEQWLISDEEHTVLSVLYQHLLERGALLPSFASAAACTVLTDEALLERISVDEIVAVGFSAFDQATQTLVGTIAERLVLFGRADDTGVAEIGFPYPQGFDFWASHMKSLSVAPSAERKVRVVECADDAQELATIAHVLERDEYADMSFSVVAPTARWARKVYEDLQKSGIQATYFAGPVAAKANPCKREDKQAAFYGALGVVAQPKSALMLRTWIGLGEWLGGSQLWAAVRQVAKAADDQARDEQTHVSLEVVLQKAGEGWLPEGESKSTLAALEQVGSLVAQAQELARQVASLRGTELVDALASHCGLAGDEAFLQELIVLPDDDAEILYERLHQSMLHPRATQSRVMVAPASQAAYLVADGVIFAGVVDGLMTPAQATDPTTPCEIREKQLNAAALQLETVKRLGTKSALISSFKQMDLAKAADYGVEIKRMYLDHGKPQARCAPSILLQEA